MKINLPPGSYILAVSGGVDSMVLLNILAKQKADVIAAHFNHGIREDSAADEKLVLNSAKKLGVQIEIGRANLGKTASEEKARLARYNFLRNIRDEYHAKAIITAHHQDDLIETAIINILRGTGRRGLTAIVNNPEIIRPLLSTPKKNLIDYAKKNHISWHEDRTNQDPTYLRNYVRLKIVPKLSVEDKQQFLNNIEHLDKLNPVLDQEIAILSQSICKDRNINRQKFINLPNEVASEVLNYILRRNNTPEINRKLIGRLVNAIKTARPHTKHDIASGYYLEVTKDYALLRQGVNS